MKKVKVAIQSFYEDRKRMPTFSEIMKLTGYKSKSAVSYAVDRLVEEGFITKDSQGKILPSNFGSLRFLGLVEAGFPSPAEEELLDTMSLDEYLIDNREATFMLRIKGDSMINAGICDGDMVLVERSGKYSEGSIVVAEVDGNWTVKFLKKKYGKFYLEPANKRYKPIFPKETMTIEAVVKAVIRKY